MKSKVVALDIDSQYVTLPLLGITTTKPGSEEDADWGTRAPNGRRSVECFEGYGRVKVKDSGDGVCVAYGHTTA